MAFIQDPRLRQRWNQISHNAEAVTENAAAGIWTFQHQYITPCLSSLADSIDSCTSLCLGDREERARRARERDRGAHRTRAEYMFDFYDDWDDDFAADQGATSSGGGGGFFSGWGGEDWDRLLAGTGNDRRHAVGGTGDAVDQPRRKRGMSYGTRGGPRRKASLPEDDPTVIPRTAPLGFLSRLPFRIGGTLRYKPSAANLRDHPGAIVPGQHQGGRRHRDENEPLLGPNSEEGDHARIREQHARESPQLRPRSNTGESEGTSSSSYRSRNDIFPSDGEGDEDAVPLDDEFAVALGRVDDGSSNRTRSTKGKRPANGDGESGISRSVSRTTIASTYSAYHIDDTTIFPTSGSEEALPTPSLEDLQREEEQAEREEYEEIERKRQAASRLAAQCGLRQEEEGASKPEPVPTLGQELESKQAEVGHEPRSEEDPLRVAKTRTAETRESPENEVRETKPPAFTEVLSNNTPVAKQGHNGAVKESTTAKLEGRNAELEFIPARLPHFG